MSDDRTARLRVFLKGCQGDWRNDTDESRGRPPPPPEEPFDPVAPVVELVPARALDLDTRSVAATIARRRSRRDFSAAPLRLDELSYLLWATQGVRELVHDQAGTLREQYRTVPSGGARHPFETYLGVSRVDGVPPGLYRYVAMQHRLVRLWPGEAVGADLAAACYGQSLVERAAAVFAWAAVPYRTEWRYAYLAPRIIAVEAGHVCQNLYLASESIGCGTCAVLAYDQKRMDALLGLDGHDMFTVYLGAVGRIDETSQANTTGRAG